MQNVTEQFKTAICQLSRELKSRITFPILVLDDTVIQRIEWDSTLIAMDDFEIGTAPMDMVRITLISEQPISYKFDDAECEIELGLGIAPDLDEYISLGLYTVEKTTKKGNVITLECVDRMHRFGKPYVSSLSYPATLAQIAQDICDTAGVVLDTSVFPNSGYTVNIKPELTDITCRVAIAQIAELAGGYARITRDGKLEIFNVQATALTEVKYAGYNLGDVLADELIINDIEVTGDNYIDFANKELPVAKIDKLIVKVGEVEVVRGAGENPYYIVDNLFCQNPNTVVDNIYSTLKGLSYIPFMMKWQGNPAIDCGDAITVYTRAGYYNTLVTSRYLVYTGGLREDYEAVGKSNTAKESTPKGSLTLDMEKAKTEIKVMDGKIEQRVTKGEFETYTEQTDQELLDRVSRGDDLKTEVTQNAESWNLSINGKLFGARYSFDGIGFSLSDGNNQALITPAGILDTNNIARSDNVADGYPLIMRFHIDDQVNSVDKVFLRLTNENFRAYSTAASSGGGDTSGSSSSNTTSSGGATTSGASSSNTTSTKSASTPTSGSVDDGFVHGVITSTGPATSGHTHTVWEGEFTHKHSVTISAHNHTMAHTHSIDGHTHGMDHTHSVPAHIHGITYGLYENNNTNNTVNIFIDGIQRANTSEKDASVNLSSWITTKGWHTVELRSEVLKRISAGLFVKSYIQR